MYELRSLVAHSILTVPAWRTLANDDRALEGQNCPSRGSDAEKRMLDAYPTHLVITDTIGQFTVAATALFPAADAALVRFDTLPN